MAEDDRNRTREEEAERGAETESEMERVDQDPDRVREGSENLGGTELRRRNSPGREDAAEEKADEDETDDG